MLAKPTNLLTSVMDLTSVSFLLFAFLGAQIIVSTIGTVWAKNPVTSALFLVLNFFSLGGLYLLLEAQFIAVVQVIVYAGAIMVLFLFTIMLLNLNDDSSFRQKFDVRKGFSVLLSAVLLLELAYIISLKITLPKTPDPILSAHLGEAKTIGKALLTDFLFPFEVISILLLLAVIGAIVLSKKNFPEEIPQ